MSSCSRSRNWRYAARQSLPGMLHPEGPHIGVVLGGSGASQPPCWGLGYGEPRAVLQELLRSCLLA